MKILCFLCWARSVWNPDLDPLSLCINLNMCPTPREAAFSQACRSPAGFWKAFSLTLWHNPNNFLCHSENIFSGQEINFLPKSIFKQQVRTNPPTKCFLRALRSFSSSAPCNNCNSQMHRKSETRKWHKTVPPSPGSCLQEESKAVKKVKPPRAPWHGWAQAATNATPTRPTGT